MLAATQPYASKSGKQAVQPVGFTPTASHPTEWAASVVGNAGLDDIDMYARSDRGEGFSTKYGDSPWRAEFSDAYRRASPIFAAEAIQAPTLVISTLRDQRVPVIQSFKFWKALEDNGAEVEFIAYDMSGHGPSDLPNSMDYWQRAVEWIGLHFDRAPGAPTGARQWLARGIAEMVRLSELGLVPP